MAACAASRLTSCPRARKAACRCGAGGSKVSNVPSASKRMALACAGMLAADSDIDVGVWINAGLAMIVAFALATLLDRAFRSRAARLAAERASQEGATRLRFVRRLLYATIVLIGIA